MSDNPPRRPFAHLPTPLEPAPRFSDALGVEVWVKRDDIGSLPLAGNKVRKLEYLVAAAIAEGADTLVAQGAAISNVTRCTAAAAAAAGIDCHLVLGGGEPVEANGNLLLCRLLGAQLHFADIPSFDGAQHWGQLHAHTEKLCAHLRDAGRRPFMMPVGCSAPHGALGFVVAYGELLAQLDERGLTPTQIFHASTSGGTHAGLVLGRHLHAHGPHVVGVGAAVVYPDLGKRLDELAVGAAQLLGHPVRPGELTFNVRFDQLGDGYARPTDQANTALRLLAQTEGILTDPVYTAKALAALVGDARAGDLTGPVVFWHTGGLPGLFEPQAAGPLWRGGVGES
ncbi:pyridoxal-phosphate dependent enzyme [Actinocrispum wychmicini]|uniref:1-aminocyclopropane-1-carboxylate deaminase/D-cysteine desulfhydrase n=1 Tax=Actinocrispum wychmicini TaxID=1213861 RepID=A0A4R2JQP3_9PSEU|nr:pyridoxal-phosphate dependent enzyme [Actinocrispum wychmicini]TCO59516.1 1-aminocyclopropane-1-carboxylate deaminase/D-cysteine desulfhydrase [Actinocrispum wychmicini]